MKARLIASDRITFSRHKDKNDAFISTAGADTHIQKSKHPTHSQWIDARGSGDRASCAAAVGAPSDSAIQRGKDLQVTQWP